MSRSATVCHFEFEELTSTTVPPILQGKIAQRVEDVDLRVGAQHDLLPVVLDHQLYLRLQSAVIAVTDFEVVV